MRAAALLAAALIVAVAAPHCRALAPRASAPGVVTPLSYAEAEVRAGGAGRCTPAACVCTRPDGSAISCAPSCRQPRAGGLARGGGAPVLEPARLGVQGLPHRRGVRAHQGQGGRGADANGRRRRLRDPLPRRPRGWSNRSASAWHCRPCCMRARSAPLAASPAQPRNSCRQARLCCHTRRMPAGATARALHAPRARRPAPCPYPWYPAPLHPPPPTSRAGRRPADQVDGGGQ